MSLASDLHVYLPKTPECIPVVNVNTQEKEVIANCNSYTGVIIEYPTYEYCPCPDIGSADIVDIA